MEGFETRDDAEMFFEDHQKHVEEEDLVEILAEYLRRFKDSRNVINDVESDFASDEVALSQVFAKVSKPQDAELKQAHPWSNVAKIQVRVRDSEPLKKGALVADTPGVADSDALVVSNTTMYLQNAGVVLLVSPILRTQRLNDLNDILRTCLSMGKAEQTYLVMTKIDQKGKQP